MVRDDEEGGTLRNKEGLIDLKISAGRLTGIEVDAVSGYWLLEFFAGFSLLQWIIVGAKAQHIAQWLMTPRRCGTCRRRVREVWTCYGGLSREQCVDNGYPFWEPTEAEP